MTRGGIVHYQHEFGHEKCQLYSSLDKAKCHHNASLKDNNPFETDFINTTI